MELVKILKRETASLKDQYVEMTAKWARSEFANLRKWAVDYHAGKFGYGEASNKYYRLPYEIVNPNGKVEDYVAKQVKSAIDHYEDSIAKLAARINAKGLDVDKIKATTSHIGVNIETTLTDGVKTVRAFTIIAGGAVQRPHYRYLIK